MGKQKKHPPVAPRLHDAQAVKAFFAWSDHLDYDVLRPLSHITSNWEASWNFEDERYEPEHNSFAADLNAVIDQIADTPRPDRYHDHEDTLAEAVIRSLNWPIQKKGNRWIGADYESILEQGAFDDLNQRDLAASAAGRVHAALDRDQVHYDAMDQAHAHMLSAVLTVMIYHRYSDGSALIEDGDDPEV